MDIELGNVCKRRLSCSFIYCSPEVKENVMLSLYTAWRHVGEGVTVPLILNLGYESGCSGSHPGRFTTYHLTNVPPTNPIWALCSLQAGPQNQSGLRLVSIPVFPTRVEPQPQGCAACSLVSRTTELLSFCLKAMKARHAVCVWRNIELCSFDHCWSWKAIELHILSVCL